MSEHREIERKYLVKSDVYLSLATESHDIRQGYLCADGIRTVRVRLLDDTGFLTIKGRGNGVSRYEWEKEISRQDALELLALCHPGRVEKTRYIVPLASSLLHPTSSLLHPTSSSLRVEVDVFHGDNDGLVFAEIELPTEDFSFQLPDWLGREVTGDPRYYNSYISAHPYKTWK